MTELQKIEKSILEATIGVIEQMGLTYFLVCGTALGAVKYDGFIPWDDDVDIGLPRKDYTVFCERAQELLPGHLFLQNHRTDVGYPLIFSKVRDSRTTYIEKNVAHLDIHHGVYIDVFPLDGYPLDAVARERLEKKKYRYLLSSLCCFRHAPSAKVALLVKGQRFLGMHRRIGRRIDRFEREIAAWDTAGSPLWCNHGNWQGKLEYAPREQYGKGIDATFEGLRVRVPENYDAYLTQKYKDWRADLPEAEKVGHHYYEVYDPHRPYTDYVERLKRGRIRVKRPD